MDAAGRETPVVEPARVRERAGKPAVLGERRAKMPVPCPKTLEHHHPGVFPSWSREW